ncbi:hypothetical protein [Paraburkholderia tagetis]|uniref:Zinc-ribbon domain-containing protein n=1 Tax=Paraburkholderia tagetis TaxID=2913261 RepID=A0A9X1UFR5_9BURK|nr:hypothetical protein [Paraburkholderia tagetis]MCG5072233.1 hypothetical protein [Paraburkholderia tagetis]
MSLPYKQSQPSSREQRRADERAAAKQQRVAPAIADPVLLTPYGHRHTEAFCLMWYACECGHREQIWNSRDGVTPFGCACPSCKEPKLQHVDWNRDTYAPNHQPATGQRMWIDMTRDRARVIAQRTIDQVAKTRDVPAHDMDRIVEAVYHDGIAPDLVIWGYVEAS